jgi:hypothetical protein
MGGALGITAAALLAGYLSVRRATQGSQAAALRIK